MPGSITVGGAAAIFAAAVFGGLAALYWTQPVEAPFATVTLKIEGHTLEVARDELSAALWNECHKAGRCEQEIEAAHAQTTPATGISGEDAFRFINWFNLKTNGNWRLPTLSEHRAYAADLPGAFKNPLFANDPRMAWAADYSTRKAYPRTVFESGHFGQLPNGLNDIGGNIWEWTSSCINANLDVAHCPAFFLGGDHEAEIPVFLRDAVTGGCAAGTPPTYLGMRLVRDI